MHFYIEHNYGHHLHAATKEDPATARYNQSVYSFWFTSIFRQYINAWSIQNKLLKNNNNILKASTIFNSFNSANLEAESESGPAIVTLFKQVKAV